MRLLPQTHLVKTGPVDHADWNYRGPLGLVQRQRFVAALKLIPKMSDRLLEIGYGSGVFLPSLSERADRLFGIDIHQKGNEVRTALRSQSIEANLTTSGAERIPFSNGSFETVVAISSLEFVTDLRAVCAEVKRVLSPGGSFVVITPGNSKIVDFGLLLLTGKSANQDFGNRRENLIDVVSSFFKLDERRYVPPLSFSVFTLYTALRFIKQT